MPSLEDYRDEVAKQIEKMSSELQMPSMDKMMEEANAGQAYAVETKTMLGVDELHTRSAQTLGQDLASRSDGLQRRFLNRRLGDDIALRDALRKNEIHPVMTKDLDREMEFRRKEECYKQKTSEQEKAANERDIPFSMKRTKTIAEEADSLRAKLEEPIDKNDSYAVGEREYEKQYLAVMDDLVKTRNSRGKVFGNYKNHIKLAEEKYRFYTEEKDRLIGREIAKVVSAGKSYKTGLARKKQADPMPANYLIDLLTIPDMFRVYNLPEDQHKILLRAMAEYAKCAEKVYELTKHIETLQDEENAQIARRKAVPEAEMPDLQYGEGEMSASFKSRLQGALDEIGAANGMSAFIESIRSEIRTWQFHADACQLCVRCILDPNGEQVGTISAHAGYIKEHFGVEFGVDTGSKLRGQMLTQRIGFESFDSEVGEYFYQRRSGSTPAARYYIEKLSDRTQQAQTGYEMQSGYERTIAESASYAVYQAYESEKKQAHEPVDSEKLMEQCADMTVLIQPLPELKRSRWDEKGVDFTAMLFSGTRDEQGNFVRRPFSYDPNPANAAAKLAEYKTHFANIEVLRNSQNNAEVKNAIMSELGLVNEAFEDVDAFMNTGLTKEIFTSKSHGEIFNNTAGMPTFERKARQLRDLISLMLRRKDVMDQVEREKGFEGIRRKLTNKWLFMNRALSFVEYRRQLIEKGYDSTMEDWAKDKSFVQDFWEKDDYAGLQGIKETKAILPNADVKIHSVPVIGEVVEGEEDEEEEDEVEKSEDEEEIIIEGPGLETVSTYSAGSGTGDDHGSDATDGAKQIRRSADFVDGHMDPEVRRAVWDNTLKDMTRSERHFLQPENYETGAFTTRKEQEDAILKDVLRGTSHAEYSAELEALKSELRKVNDQLSAAPAPELVARQTELREQIDATERLLDNIMIDAYSKTMELLDLVKIPNPPEEPDAPGDDDEAQPPQNTKKKKRGVRFADEVRISVIYTETDEIEDSVEYQSVMEAFQEERSRIELRGKHLRRDKENISLYEDEPAKDAVKLMNRERDSSLTAIHGLSEDEMRKIARELPLTGKLANILSNMGSLILPLPGAEADKDADLKGQTTKYMRDLLVILKRDATGDELKDPVQNILDLIGSSYDDITRYLDSDLSSGLLDKRIPSNYGYRDGEELKLTNQFKNVSGISPLRIKAQELLDVITAIMPREELMSEEVKAELQQGRAKLEGLVEYLSWREERIRTAKDEIIFRRDDYTMSVTDHPEEWTHDAFKWK